jgi:hypothetical protein
VILGPTVLSEQKQQEEVQASKFLYRRRIRKVDLGVSVGRASHNLFLLLLVVVDIAGDVVMWLKMEAKAGHDRGCSFSVARRHDRCNVIL